MATTAIQQTPDHQSMLAVRGMLNKSLEQIATALPKHMNAERMVRVAITAVQKQPLLLKCSPISIVGSVIEASQLGLYPDGILGEAYLVPYWNAKNRTYECQLQPGYRGYITLARRSGQVSIFYAEPVYECDHFAVKLGLEHTLEHVPNYDDPTRGVKRDKDGVPEGLRGFYAVIKFKDGEADFHYMPLFQILETRARSKSKNRDGDTVGPWVTDFEAMGIKTPIRRLAKRCPLSPEFVRAAVLDEYVDAGVAPPSTDNVMGDGFSGILLDAAAQKAAQLAEKYVRPPAEIEAPEEEEEPDTQLGSRDEPEQPTLGALDDPFAPNGFDVQTRGRKGR